MKTSNSKIKIFVVDDHAVVRQGIKHIIVQNPDMEVVGEASHGNEVLDKIQGVDVDVMLMDIEMPEKSGWEVMTQIKHSHPNMSVIILSIFPEDHYGVRLIKAGASGYLTKSSAPEQLVQAIRTVSGGGKFISPALGEKLIQELDKKDDQPLHSILSEREFQVFCMIASGKKTKEIADELSLSITTISTHRANILEKMGMKNNAELIHYALKNGLVR